MADGPHGGHQTAHVCEALTSKIKERRETPPFFLFFASQGKLEHLTRLVFDPHFPALSLLLNFTIRYIWRQTLRKASLNQPWICANHRTIQRDPLHTGLPGCFKHLSGKIRYSIWLLRVQQRPPQSTEAHQQQQTKTNPYQWRGLCSGPPRGQVHCSAYFLNKASALAGGTILVISLEP